MLKYKHMQNGVQKSLFDLDSTDVSSEVWNELSNSSLKYEQSIDPLLRKRTGSYYTSMSLTSIMMSDLLNSMGDDYKRSVYKKRFLEPCVGTGNFVFAYLKHCATLGLSRNESIELINNIYACDINDEAISLYKKNLKRYVKHLFNINLNDSYFSTHVGGGLLFDVDSENIDYISIDSIFPEEVIQDGFDIIVTNPPYKNLKAERSQYLSDTDYDMDREKYFKIGSIAKQRFLLSTTGTLNLYRLFVEEILMKYSSNDCFCSLLIPSSILSDKSCSDLRTYMINETSLRNIRLYPETSAYIDASQSVCSILLRKGQPTKELLVFGSNSDYSRPGAKVSIFDIADKDTGNAILILNDREYSIRNQMSKHPKIRDLPYIHNLRGELDISLNKNSIVGEETDFVLLRGRNIAYYELTNMESLEHASPVFYEQTAKRTFIERPRLVCQQIVNMAKARRVAFAPVPKNVILANSCNFISLDENDDNIDLFFLLGVLNSSVIDWYFKLTSSNNHINNYEIDNFPIPVHSDNKQEISECVKKYLNTKDTELLNTINSLVNEAFGIVDYDNETRHKGGEMKKEKTLKEPLPLAKKDLLVERFRKDLSHIIDNITADECQDILFGNTSIKEIILAKKPDIDRFLSNVASSMETKYRGIFESIVLNHTTFKLSDLDLEMIKPIPQGGNWTNIPEETVKKSKRLMRISETGGRTTLYGRLAYNKPSYTITTYFNRPGNGTYVHPTHERVLSVREAARFQCFPDSYYFYGNKKDTLEQIGNAVPTLLAYNIGKSIKEKTGCSTSVDLFSGAGGLTYGFKLAGIRALISNDFFEASCVTLKTNCPEIDVTCGDITDDNVKKRVIEAGIKGKADIICGGPPCQGFSLAGYRNADDPRNQMFRHFVEIVSKVNPKVVVFENVEGLMSFQGGKTYRNIISLFSELGYEAEGHLLHTVQYGAPQKRKRVIILCIRKDLKISPSDVYPKPITPEEENQITVKDTIFDLENVECSESARYASDYSSPIIKFFKGGFSAEEYCKTIAHISQ